MKVFISWSGDLSRDLAEAIRDWLPAVLQSVKPFFTPNDIEKGARWAKDIAKELEDSAVGIFCLTKENLNKPWIMFEAGALSKKIDFSRVCPVLFNVDSTELEGPLVQFQASPFSESEIRKLVKTINSTLGESKLDDTVLNTVFEMWWPKLNERVSKILASHEANSTNKQSARTDREILEEVLELARFNASSGRKVRGSHSDAAALGHILKIIQNFVDENDDLFNGHPAIELIENILQPIEYLTRRLDAPIRNEMDLTNSIINVRQSIESKNTL